MGNKGITLFIIPKFLPAADGSAGERNGVRCGSIEHKMGGGRLGGFIPCQAC